ncbi:hypothetical protein RDI58_024651 [Solanum bulbocastanum]|uniref:Uncharacterized protein n=1 Tax=Solanum bulbocastanum TaxID=147425 RepID=A0AAN8SY18_SOLBU
MIVLMFVEVVDLGGEGEAVNIGESIDVNLGEEGEVVNLCGESINVNLGEEGEVVNLGGEVVDVNLGGEDVDDNLGGEGKSNFFSGDSELGDTPLEDGSDIDEDMEGGVLLKLIVREIQVNKVILKQELEHNQVNKVLFVMTTLLCQELLKQDLEWKVHHTLLPEPYMQLHNQVNQAQFVVIQHLCQDLLKKGCKLGLKED